MLAGLSILHAKPKWTSVQANFQGSDCFIQTWQIQAHQPTHDLVLWFHGGMNSSFNQKGLTASLALSQIWQPTLNTVLISCSAWNQRNWLHPQTIHSLDLCLDQHLGSAKLHLIGVSDGSLGVLAYQLLGQHPAQSGTLISSYPGLILAPTDLQNPRMSHIRWTLIQGGQDRLYPLDAWQNWMHSWAQSLPQTQFHIDPLGEHDYSYWSTHHLDWILQSLR